MADSNNNGINEIRQVVREEVSEIKEEQQRQGTLLKDLQKDAGKRGTLLKDLQKDAGKRGTLLKDLQKDAGKRGTLLKDLQKDARKQGVLLENLDSEFKTVAESISNNLKVKSRVDGHEERITDLEADNKLVKPTVALHSKQIKSLQSG
jgi:hypothetical protein